MKKLLLCAFALTHALAIHCMNDGLKSLFNADGGIANLTKLTGVVTRCMLAEPTAAVTVDIIDHSADEKEEQPSTSSSSSSASSDHAIVPRAAGLRLHVNEHNSWNRVSIADQYPADDEDTWDIVTNHDAREAKVLETAQIVLAQAQSLVPEDLKPHIKPNVYDSSNPLKELETARELIWACMTRTAPTFATDYVETLTKNFGPCKQYDADFDYSKVYAYFAYDDAVAMEEQNETFAHLIKEKLETAVTANDEKTQWFMRQFGFMFRDAATKQTYDAYLKGGIDALNALRIPEAKNEILQACFDQIAEAKYALKELQKSKK